MELSNAAQLGPIYVPVASYTVPSNRGQSHNDYSNTTAIALERTRAFALFLSFIQCFPESTANLDSDQIRLIQTHQTFDPNEHLSEYVNVTEVTTLIQLVNNYTTNNIPIDRPFTNDPSSIIEFQQILIVLYRNSDNWKLVYNTTAWLLGRANIGRLLWSLIVLADEKYTDTVIFPSIPETIPQLYINKRWVLPAAGLNSTRDISANPMDYWTTDPGLNEFHIYFHQDQPIWWDDEVYGVPRHRRGELFFCMHHQIVNRYNAERLSNGLGEVIALDLVPKFVIPEGYKGDIVQFDYSEFRSRPDNFTLGDFDSENTIQLSQLRQWHDQINQGIQDGYLKGKDGGKVSILGENGTDILGNTVEASNKYSANRDYYGTLHNMIHRYLSGVLRRKVETPLGVQAHQETAMRDRVFYNIHKFIDSIYMLYKEKDTKPYTKEEIQFSKVSILSVRLSAQPQISQVSRSSYGQQPWPFMKDEPFTFTTFKKTTRYNINNAARPCKSINDESTVAEVEGIDHAPFWYNITLESTRPEVSYGMVRIFLWPEALQNGTKLEGDKAHSRAIELDRFHVRIMPNTQTTIMKSSQDSTVTRLEPSPGLKKLYNSSEAANLVQNKNLFRGCGFPNNLLIPRGTPEGLSFKLTVMISDETDEGFVDDDEFPRFPMCGTLNGKKFPDKRAMGFPFDRPGTILEYPTNQTATNEAPKLLNNFKQMAVTIKHLV